MGQKTKIQWTEASWNPVRGCSIVSPGCKNCYAMSVAARFSDPGLPFHGFAKRTHAGPAWTRKLGMIDDHLMDPVRWQRSRLVFVNSMSDLFHENLGDDVIDQVFAVMAICAVDPAGPKHVFQILTKRADRMHEYMTARSAAQTRQDLASLGASMMPAKQAADWWERLLDMPWPLPNVCLGVSVESQLYADQRIPELLLSPAAVHFVSYEPALGPVTYERYMKSTLVTHSGERVQHPDPRASEGGTWDRTRLNWVIVGGESGTRARPFDVAWARQVVREGDLYGCPVFVKQMGRRVVDSEWRWGTYAPDDRRTQAYAKALSIAETATAPNLVLLRNRKGDNVAEWPEDLRVRRYPPLLSALAVAA